MCEVGRRAERPWLRRRADTGEESGPQLRWPAGSVRSLRLPPPRTTDIRHHQEATLSVQWRSLAEATRVTPGSTVDLAKDVDPGRHDEQLGKDAGTAALAEAEAALLDLQDRFL